MKRLSYLVFFSLFLLLTLSPCRAAGEPSDGWTARLPEAVADQFPDAVAEKSAEGDLPGAAAALDVGFFASFFSRSFALALEKDGPALATLFAAVLLAALIAAFAESAGPGVGRALHFASGFCTVLAALQLLHPVWQAVSDALSVIGLILKSLLPAVTALGAAAGEPTAAAVHGVWISLLLTLLEQLCEAVLAPLFGVCFGFVLLTAFSRFSDMPDLAGAAGSVSRLFTLFAALIGAALSAVLTGQSVLARRSDGLLLRSLKFASGNLIPVVGGALSEATSHYLASLSVIRSAAGTITAGALIVSILPILLRLFLCRAGLALAGTLAGLFGCAGESAALREAAVLPDLALALLSLCAVLFLIQLGVFAVSAVPA